MNPLSLLLPIVKRRLCTILASLSLILCVGAAIWVRPARFLPAAVVPACVMARGVRRPARPGGIPAFLFILLCLAAPIVPLGCSANELVLGSNRSTVDPHHARRQMIDVDGRAVEIWHDRSPGAATAEPRAYSLFFTGKADRADRWTSAVAEAWGDKPIEVWGVNYPGSGGTEGPVRLDRVIPDAVGAFDALRRTAGTRPIYLQGASFGTAAALGVAARRPVSGLILQNPAALHQLILGRYGWWNLWLIAGPVARQIPADLDAIASAQRAMMPAVFLQSGGDEIIPARYQQFVVDAYAGPKHVIQMPYARHADALTSEAAAKLKTDRDWLWETAGLEEPDVEHVHAIK